ncbi:MAG: NTP transferase domain-containing protein [Bacteroidia bacterium]|nr:NTP transferase domain-containing protein [Bacteroidia bacterium]
MKAVIPVAGAGTRLRPHTYTQPKTLIPVAGKPIIGIIIDQLKAVGVDDFVFIIGHLGEKIRDYITNSYPDLNCEFVHQYERLGIGHAIWSAREELKDADEIMIILGDSIIDGDFKALLEDPHSMIMIKKVSTPGTFGVVETDDQGIITNIVEKPKIPKSNLAVVGVYKIKEVEKLINAIQYNIDHELKTLDEYQLTDAIMAIINDGVRIGTMRVDNWFDCGKKEILLNTNRMLLEKATYPTDDFPAYFNSIIIHPVSIGTNCDIQNSVIGPHVTISDNVVIHSAIIKNSIIGDYAKIEDIVLDDSIVGNDAAVKGFNQSLNIGDNTEIDFS